MTDRVTNMWPEVSNVHAADMLKLVPPPRGSWMRSHQGNPRTNTIKGRHPPLGPVHPLAWPTSSPPIEEPMTLVIFNL
jgi:hypothetical protein